MNDSEDNKHGRKRRATLGLMKNLSVHGVPRIIHSEKQAVKIIWLLAILISSISCVYFLTITIIDYLKYDVITVSKSIEKEMEYFPAVTICSKNKISLEDIISCEYEKQSCDINADFDIFRIINAQNYTKCIRFNRNDVTTMPKVNRFIGLDHGFNVKISTNETDHYIVFVADNYLNSFKGVNANYFRTKGFYGLRIEKFSDTKLEHPYNNCLLKSKEYKEKNCIEKCVQQEFAIKFNCTVIGYYMNNNLNICSDKTYKENHKKIQNDLCHCDKECETNNFMVYSMIERETDINSVHLTVYFGNLVMFEYSQVPKMTGAMVLSNIGGTLGIFLGLRFLTFVEVIEYFVELSFIHFSK